MCQNGLRFYDNKDATDHGRTKTEARARGIRNERQKEREGNCKFKCIQRTATQPHKNAVRDLPNPNRAKLAKTNTAPSPCSLRCGLNAVQLKRGSGAIYLNAVQTRFVTPQNPNRAKPAKTNTAPRPDSVKNAV